MTEQPKQEVEIDGKTYFFGDWPTEKGINILTWLANSFGGALASFMAVGKATDGDPNKQAEMEESIERMLGPAIQGIFSNLSDAKVNEKLRMMAAGEDVRCDGQAINYNQHYSRKIGLLVKVVSAQLQYQYSDFLSELLSLTGDLNALKGQPQQ